MNRVARLWLAHPRLPRIRVALLLCVTTLLAAVALLVGDPDGPRPRLGRSGDAAGSVQAMASFRQHWMARTYQDQRVALAELRRAHDEAVQRGDRHARWLLLAWLVRTTAVFDIAAARSLHAQAEAEIARAEAAGDRLAAFELALMVESMGVQQLGRPADAARLQRLQQIARDLGSPLHAGLVAKLRGLLASHAGQDGEAQFHLEDALARLPGRFERAEVQMLMAISLIDHPGASATQLAIAYLDDVVHTLPPEQYPGLLTPAIRLSLLLGRVGRHAEAIALADRALQIAQRSGLASERARARVARAQTLLAAGDYRAALSDFDAAPASLLPPTYALQATAGRALCLAQLRDPDAPIAVMQARHRGAALQGATEAGRAQFHETLSTAWRALGQHAQALEELQAAADIREHLAALAQSRLADARHQSVMQDDQAAAAAERRVAWGTGNALLVLLAAGAAWHLRGQRRARCDAAAGLQARYATHGELLALNRAHARQLETICQALRRPARALGLLMQSDALRSSPTDVQHPHLQAVRDCSQVLVDTVEALLDMLRLQEGSYVPHPERFDLARLLQEIGEAVEPVARRRGLRWDLQAEVCGVFTDRHLLRRIVINLLDHLMRQADHGSLQVRVRPLPSAQALEIGCSALAQVPRLGFGSAADPADSADSGERDELGLGPATARRACDLLGHRLTGSPDAQAGIVLRLELPSAMPPAGTAPPTRPAPSGRSVALVEDDAFSRITLMNALVDAGLEVQAYASFAELMAPSTLHTAGVPGVLISDLHLGDYGDATDALRELRRRPQWRDVPVLMLTGDIRDEVHALATELGVALAYKPISVRRLLERIALLRSPQPLPVTSAPAGRAAGTAPLHPPSAPSHPQRQEQPA